jgi:hypothetical protein
MTTIHVDKIASVTKNLSLPHSIEITENIPSEEGTVLVAEVLENKKEYNMLELPTGRLSVLRKGDIIAVALGKRRALKGFVGNIPPSLHVGESIHILNIGGVAGVCVSENMSTVGRAFPIKVLGAATKNGDPLNIRHGKKFELQDELVANTPLIVVSGTCMNVGKTSVACEIISQFSRNGYKVCGTKLAGVACLRDTERMKDYGAKEAVSFLDAGLTATVHQNGKSVSVTRGAIDYLAKENPDFIIVEFGDGVFGEYGVMNILKNREIAKNIALHIGCAHDPMGAMKLFEVCQDIGTPLHIFSGPVTDNSVGRDFVQKEMKLPAFNALYSSKELFQYLQEHFL